MTISQLAKLNKKHGGHFFDHDNMKVAGDTQKSYRIESDELNKTVILTRKRDNHQWEFSAKTGRVTHA